jgi:hypothetical protein
LAIGPGWRGKKALEIVQEGDEEPSRARDVALIEKFDRLPNHPYRGSFHR